MYIEHLREEQAKKRQEQAERLRQKAHKRKMGEIKAEDKCLHEKHEKLKTKLSTAQEAMDRAVSCIEEGQKKISHRLNVKDMMEVEAENKLIQFGM